MLFGVFMNFSINATQRISYINMGRKPKEYKYVKKNDGRKNNGRKKGQGMVKKTMATPARINDAKKNRIGIYALNAMKEVFGSEEEAWRNLAEQAKDSFPHMKLLFEYKYGKAGETIEETKSKKVDINIKNLFAGSQDKPQENDVIDVTPEDNE